MKKLVQLASVATIFVVSAATASDNDTLNGFSIQGSFGSYTHDLTIGDFNREKSDTGFGIRASYQATPAISIDAGYFDFGAYSDSYIDQWNDRVTDEFATTAFKVGVTGYYSLTESTQLFGRLGVAFWDSKFSVIEHDAPEFSFSISDSGNNVYYGVGVQYSVNENLALALEFTFLNVEATLIGVDAESFINGTAASIKYSF